MVKKRNLISDAFECDIDQIVGAAEHVNETARYLIERLIPVESIARLMARRVEKMPASELLAEVEGMLIDWQLTHARDTRIDNARAVIAEVIRG